MYDVEHGDYSPDEKKTERQELRLGIFKKKNLTRMKIIRSDREINNRIL